MFGIARKSLDAAGGAHIAYTVLWRLKGAGAAEVRRLPGAFPGGAR